MPIRKIPPELFLRYRGVRIYRVYINGNVNDMSPECYTTDRDEDPMYVFNVRFLAEWKPGVHDLMKQNVIDVIRAAIRGGSIMIPPKREHHDQA